MIALPTTAPVIARSAATKRLETVPKELHVQDMGYRWGSADRRGHLYFHWRVAMLPYRAIEYVVAHELTHLVHREHTEAFWLQLGRLVPDHQDWRRWLAYEGARYDL